MDQDGLDGVAGGGVLGLGIKDDIDGHFFVDVFVHVDVADAVSVAHDRDLCIVHDVLDELVGAAGDEEVDILIALEEFIDLVVEFGLQEAGGRQARADGGLVDDGKEDAVGAGCLLAALEDGAVSALEAEGGDLDQGVGAGLKDDADDADGDADALQDQVCVQLALEEGAADGVGEADQLVDALADIGEFGLVEEEALHDGGSDAVFLCRPAVFGVGGKDLVFLGCQLFSDRPEGSISHLI